MSEGQRTTDVLRKINRPKPSFLSKVRNLVIGTTVVAGGGAAIEAVAHPVGSIVDTAKNVAVEQAENIQEAGESLVEFYNKDAEIENFNKQVSSRLNGRTPLLEGEQIFEKVKVVPAGVNFEERQKMIDEKAPVNVREFPSTYTPTGNSTDVLGTLPQGAEINHAMRLKSVAPNSKEEGDWYAFLWRSPNAGENEPFKIGYIYGIYIQPESTNTVAGE